MIVEDDGNGIDANGRFRPWPPRSGDHGERPAWLGRRMADRPAATSTEPGCRSNFGRRCRCANRGRMHQPGMNAVHDRQRIAYSSSTIIRCFCRGLVQFLQVHTRVFGWSARLPAKKELALARALRPGLILLGLNMRDLSGLDVLRGLRSGRVDARGDGDGVRSGRGRGRRAAWWGGWLPAQGHGAGGDAGGARRSSRRRTDRDPPSSSAACSPRRCAVSRVTQSVGAAS